MSLFYSFLMMLAAVIWGGAFVAQKAAMDSFGPYTFNALRSYIGAIALLPLAWYLARAGKAAPGKRSDLILGGICCGFWLTVSTLLQQVGLIDVEPGKAGFLTAMYILIVPLLGCFLRKIPSVNVWIAVAIALCGAYFLSIKSDFTIEHGDLLVLGCAFTFSFHVMTIDFFARRVDPVQLSCLQFFVCALLSSIPMFVVDKFAIPTGDLSAAESLAAAFGALSKGFWPLLFTGVFSSGVAYTLQIVSQKHLNATVATLIMSLESVFAALFGWLIRGEELTQRELLGCCLVFAAVILSQVDPSLIFRRKGKV